MPAERFRHLQQLESIVNDSADVIFSLDAENRFPHLETGRGNHLRLAGRGNHRPAFQRDRARPELVKAGEVIRIEEHIRSEGHYYMETERMAKDGRRVLVEVTVSELRGLQGSVIGRSAILRDITERKRLEEAKLQGERLAVIGAMSAKLAHEIRNPLSSITLNIDLASDEIDTLAREAARPPRRREPC